MNPDRQQAINYLSATGDGLWRWSENGAVLVWRDGSTIAFREEIVQILTALASNGLPSFGAIVFLLAACRGKVPAIGDILVESKTPLPPAMGSDAPLLLSARKQLKAQLEAALGQFAKAARLPAELNTGLKARCLLAEAVFEPAKAERHVAAAAVLRGLSEPLSDNELVDPLRVSFNGSYIRQIHIVAEGLKPHTAESLALRLRTGLDALPKAVEDNLPMADRARRLIEKLSRDREFGAVARAARELMAAVRLPRRLGANEQLAIGGVADITNRGPLDRLLLSELAHDDLTLAVRVALNEALYLRREPPLREPPGSLALVLDSGVRLWGVPRVLATAVALALIARDKQHSDVLAWRAQGKQLQPVDLFSRPGLTQHLGALETTAHPGAALPAFAAACPADAHNQSVLITHADTLADPEFRRMLAEAPGLGFMATVDRAGRFELHALPLAHRPALCEADLDLVAIFDESAGVSPINATINPNLPAIFGSVPFPFLLPLAGKVDFWIKADDGHGYAVINERLLVQFRDRNLGGRILAGDLPGGKTMWMELVEGTLHLVKAGASQRPARLLSVSLPPGELRVTDLVSGSELHAVHRYGDAILAIRSHDVRTYALSDGHPLGQAANPHQWENGRFFRGSSHFYFAVWDGERVKFEPVMMAKELALTEIIGVFDRDGLEGPWLLHTDGDVISTLTGEKIRLLGITGYSSKIYSFTPSRDGHRLIWAWPEAKWSIFQDLKTGRHLNNPNTGSAAHLLEPLPSLPSRNLFRDIESIARLRDGLAFCGRNQRWRKLTLSQQGKMQIMLLPIDDQHEIKTNKRLARLVFTDAPKPTQRGFTLRTAEFPDGSKVLLDSRGLLHLKSSDSDLHEISLVLADAEVVGWTSDGHVCGPAFFFDGPFTSEPAHVFGILMMFLAKL